MSTWTFYLNITNDTDRDLEVIESQLHWGYWNTDDVEDKGPQTIPAGKTVTAVGAKAAFGPNGYEFSCSWKAKEKSGENPYGILSIYVDVPYKGSNSSQCTTDGLLTVSGWENLPSDGHNFVKNIKISTPNLGPKKEFDNSQIYKDWSKVQTLDEISNPETLDLNKYIPKGLNFEKLYVCRTPIYSIPQKLWCDINDPNLNNNYSKDLYVDSYFSLAVTALHADSNKIETVTKGGKITVKNQFELSSSSKSVEEKIASIETVLSALSKSSASAKVDVAEAKEEVELKAEIKAKYGITTIQENSTQTKETKTVEVTFEAPKDKDMDVVPWTFSKIVLMFRKDKKEGITLIGASEWEVSRVFRSYEQSAENNLKIIGAGGNK